MPTVSSFDDDSSPADSLPILCEPSESSSTVAAASAGGSVATTASGVTGTVAGAGAGAGSVQSASASATATLSGEEFVTLVSLLMPLRKMQSVLGRTQLIKLIADQALLSTALPDANVRYNCFTSLVNTF